MLLIGIAGSQEEVERTTTEIRSFAEANHSQEFRVLTGAEEDMVWVNQRQIKLYSTPELVKTRVVVPISKVVAIYQAIQKEASIHQLKVGITGRVGSGIFYPSFSVERSGTIKILTVISNLAQIANKLGGFLLVESGPLAVKHAHDIISERSDYGLMKHLKQTFDPQNIFNPGKLVRS